IFLKAAPSAGIAPPTAAPAGTEETAFSIVSPGEAVPAPYNPLDAPPTAAPFAILLGKFPVRKYCPTPFPALVFANFPAPYKLPPSSPARKVLGLASLASSTPC